MTDSSQSETQSLDDTNNVIDSSAAAIKPDAVPDVAAEEETPPPQVDSNHGEEFAYNADIAQLLSIIINSVYSQNEVFVRELISNASDAIDKVRFLALTDPSLLDTGKELEIQVLADKNTGTLTITDTGIGMTRQQMKDNLGVLAHSGTKQFVASLAAGADISQAGSFGCGFYSSFLVADRVEVFSKHNDEAQAHCWVSSAGGDSFAISKVASDQAPPRGTRIVMHMKSDQLEFLEEHRLRSVIKTHSNFIAFPIKLWCSKTESVVVTDDEEEEEQSSDTASELIKKCDEEVATKVEAVRALKEAKAERSLVGAAVGELVGAKKALAEAKGKLSVVEDDGKVKIEEVEEEEKQKEKKTKTIQQTSEAFEVVNSSKPIWHLSPSEVTDEEYDAFYKATTNDYQNPLTKIHFHVEGTTVEFNSILYVPARAPHDVYESSKKNLKSISVYCRRVFITSDSFDLLPQWCGFIRGTVDANNLPLSISRETIQKSAVLKAIQKTLIKKVIKMLSDLAEEDAEKYRKFYAEYSKCLKLGVHGDTENRIKLAELLRYPTLNGTDDDETTTIGLKEYVAQMKEDQEHIYFICADTVQQGRESPCVEALKKRGYDVLIMTDCMDVYIYPALPTYSDKKLIDASSANLELPASDDLSEAALKGFADVVCAKVKEVLGDRIQSCVVSTRLTDTPVVVTSGKWGDNAFKHKAMRAQALAQSQAYSSVQKILEINPSHAIIQSLKEKIEADAPGVKDIIHLLYENGLLMSGFALDESKSFGARVLRMLTLGMGIEQASDDDDEKPDGGDADSEDVDADATTEMESVD